MSKIKALSFLLMVVINLASCEAYAKQSKSSFMVEYVDNSTLNVKIKPYNGISIDGYKTLEFSLDLRVDQSALDFKLLSSHDVSIFNDRGGRVLVYHKLRVDSEYSQGVLLYIMINNQKFTYPIVNLSNKSLPISIVDENIYISNARFKKGDKLNVEYWLEAGLVHKDHKYGVRDSL